MHIDLLLADLVAAFSAWLLTYLLHSTLLIASVWLLVRCRRSLSIRNQERLWRTALLGGLLTASAQLAVGWEPWSGRVHVAAASASALHGTNPVAGSPAPRPLAPVGPVGAPTPALAAAAPMAPPAAPGRPLDPLPWIAGLWLAGLLLGTLRAARGRARLQRRLATRRPLGQGPLAVALATLQQNTGFPRPVTLTAMPDLGSPLALGILRPEIVIPARTATDLTGPQRDVMLAHELAHHVRRDLLWLTLARCMNVLFFFQPLGLLASRHLRETSELLADEWAAAQTGRRRDLAECLTVVAGWMLRAERAALPLPAMAAAGSMLERRVQRLLEPPACTSPRRVSTLLAVLPLVAVAGLAPNVTAGTAHAAPEPTAIAVGEASTPSSRLDAEIAALTRETATLLDLLDRVAEPPPTLVRAAGRLRARMNLLHERRLALARAAQETKR